MSTRTITLASVAGALMLSGSSSGGFTGLAVTLQPGSPGGTDVDAYRLYATFDSALDEVVAVGGTLLFPQTLDSGGGGFFQVTVFGATSDLAQSDFGVGFEPDLIFDSFLTLGVPQGYLTATPPPTLPIIQFFNLADFNSGAPVVETPDGGWLTPPGPPKLLAKPYPPANTTPDGGGDGVYCTFTQPAGATHGVLLGQFSVAQGNTFSGDLGVLAVYQNGFPVALTAPDTVFSFNEACAFGACCLGPEDCTQGVTEAECATSGGVFLGLGSLCQYQTFQIFHEGPPNEWSHSFDTITNCPSGTDGPGCVSGPVKIDAWQTTPLDGGGSSNCENFGAASACPIPADFFGPGSDPFSEIVCFAGDPIGTTTIPGFGGTLDFGDADTLVTRPNDPFDRCELPSATPVVVPIQMEQLSLVSVDPIVVTFNGGQDPEEWAVSVQVLSSAGQPGGTMSVTKSHCNGGTFDSTIAVCPKFILTKIDAPFTELELDFCATCDPGGIVMSSDGIPWVHETDDILEVMNPVCSEFIPAIEDVDPLASCDCNTNSARDKCDIEAGISNDCNLNGIPDECEAPPVCPADLNDDCSVGFADILLVIAAWGPCPPMCPEDLDGSNDVGFSDLLFIIGQWGPCS